MTQKAPLGALETICDAITTAMDVEGLLTAFGERERSVHGRPPRIVWVPTGGTLAKPDRTGPISYAGGILEPLYSGLVTMEAHVWAASFAELEALWVLLLDTARDCLGTASDPGAFRFDTQIERAGRSHGDWEKLTQLFTWDLNLTQINENTVPDGTITNKRALTIATFTHTCSLDLNLPIP